MSDGRIWISIKTLFEIFVFFLKVSFTCRGSILVLAYSKPVQNSFTLKHQINLPKSKYIYLCLFEIYPNKCRYWWNISIWTYLLMIFQINITVMWRYLGYSSINGVVRSNWTTSCCGVARERLSESKILNILILPKICNLVLHRSKCMYLHTFTMIRLYVCF